MFGIFQFLHPCQIPFPEVNLPVKLSEKNKTPTNILTLANHEIYRVSTYKVEHKNTDDKNKFSARLT